MQSYHRVFSLLTVLCLIGCGGPGPQRAAINGTVTYDGESVGQGTITFVPTGDTKGTSAGGEIKDGKYSIPSDKGTTLGKYKVQIRWSKKTGKQIEMGSPAPPGTKIDEVAEAIPAKYNTETTLEKEVTTAKHVFDFKLDK